MLGKMFMWGGNYLQMTSMQISADVVNMAGACLQKFEICVGHTVSLQEIHSAARGGHAMECAAMQENLCGARDEIQEHHVANRLKKRAVSVH